MTRQLTRDSVLRRAETITLTIRSAGDAIAVVDGADVDLGVHACAILAACIEPCTFGELTDRVSARGARDFAALAATILRMVDEGILLTADATSHIADTARWASPEVHIGMLNDEARTSAFLAAVEELTRPDDVVLDIGSGTGVLAVGAARAGAREVYAIEASAMAEKARALAAANDVADRLTVIQAWSTRVELPKRASVLVTETLGNDPLGEHIIDIVADAKKRLLMPGARIIPRRVDLYGVLIELPVELRQRHAFSLDGAEAWSRRYGIELGSLAAPPARGYVVTLNQHDGALARELSQPALLGSVDFTTDAVGFEPRTVDLRATERGQCVGVLYYFEAALTPTVTISTRPSGSAAENSWSSNVWLEPQPREVDVGAIVRVNVRSRAARTYVEVARD